jgi:hypothetical protein
MKINLYSKNGYFYLLPSINIIRYYEGHTYTSATLAPGQIGQYVTKRIDFNLGFLFFEIRFAIYKQK